jgi:hypothetical protein
MDIVWKLHVSLAMSGNQRKMPEAILTQLIVVLSVYPNATERYAVPRSFWEKGIGGFNYASSASRSREIPSPVFKFVRKTLIPGL